MQTFLPDKSFLQSARVLDRMRLGKQRVEAKQIYLALTTPNYGWTNHPAVKMWRGHESALASYGFYICAEWRARGYQDTLMPWFQKRLSPYAVRPAWADSPDFHRAHQSNLIRKLPEHYRPLWPEVPDNLPYIWPIVCDNDPVVNSLKR